MRRDQWGIVTDHSGKPVKGPMIVGVGKVLYTHSNSVYNTARRLTNEALTDSDSESDFRSTIDPSYPSDPPLP